MASNIKKVIKVGNSIGVTLDRTKYKVGDIIEMQVKRKIK